MSGIRTHVQQHKDKSKTRTEKCHATVHLNTQYVYACESESRELGRLRVRLTGLGSHDSRRVSVEGIATRLRCTRRYSISLYLYFVALSCRPCEYTLILQYVLHTVHTCHVADTHSRRRYAPPALRARQITLNPASSSLAVNLISIIDRICSALYPQTLYIITGII